MKINKRTGTFIWQNITCIDMVEELRKCQYLEIRVHNNVEAYKTVENRFNRSFFRAASRL